ncbi:DUF1304 domain-containing protein [Planktotalea sp.]|uniref:DUF1304 domain-containing protein n=1 Tax=Planktotalea sp. TaxID=2029877 RepID=UPI00329686C7
MRLLALAFIALTALLHIYIAWFEMFAWTTKGPEIFTTFAPELFEPTIQMAANQGLYNLFLAAGLIWSLLIKDPKWQFNIAACFLLFVAIAGIGAAVTIAFRSGMPQMVPSIIGLVALVLSRRSANA